MIFQAMFAIITPGLILGAFAERMPFERLLIFSLLWAMFIYFPVCTGSGATADSERLGVLDFAGGSVVHITAGVSALAAALFLGRRQGYPHTMSPPHSLPLAVLGAGLFWFGWFGFNAGSASRPAGWRPAPCGDARAAAAAGITWAVLDWGFNKRPTMLGMITGAVAGLAAVTPASGFMSPMRRALGVGASIICWLAVTFVKNWLKYDDSLDAFGFTAAAGCGGPWPPAFGLPHAINWEQVKTDGLFRSAAGCHLS